MRIEREEQSYRLYISDTMKMINDKLFSRFGGSVFEYRYYDLVKTKKKKDNRTANQIAEDVIARGGLIIKEGGEDNSESSI